MCAAPYPIDRRLSPPAAGELEGGVKAAHGGLVAASGARCEQVMALYADMQQRGLQPNAVVYGTLVHAAGEVGRWEQALELMLEAAQRGISLDVQGYTAAIDACAASFQVSVTLAVFTRRLYRERRPSLDPPNVLIVVPNISETSQASSSHRMLVLSLASSAVSVYASTENACTGCEQPERAVEVFQIMRSAGVRPNLHTYTTVMNLYANVHAPALLPFGCC